jgi:hypothetical protein
MKTRDNNNNLPKRKAGFSPRQKGSSGRLAGNEEDNNLSGYPIYPANEDIYSKYKEVKNIDPEDTSKNKTLKDNNGLNNEKDFDEDVSGNDLDIPGDDNQENIGSEDEENNYYSLGGDDHDDLEEDKGA